MRIPERVQRLQLLVIEYLYGDLSEDEMRRFERELETNAELREMLV